MPEIESEQFELAQAVMDLVVEEVNGALLADMPTTTDLLNAMAELGLELAAGDGARKEIGWK